MLLLLLVGFASGLGVPPRQETFNLTIVHINDIHAHFEQTNVNTTRCRPEDLQNQDCYGGIARVYSKTRQILETDPDALFLNAGDFYQGTVWYTQFKWRVVSLFSNLLQFDAMTLGNHEFDDRIAGLLPFLANQSSPVVVTNLNISRVPELQGLVRPSLLLEIAGKKVHIIYFTNISINTVRLA